MKASLMERRDFLKGLFLGVVTLATPKIIFDLGANSHRYPKGFITYDTLTNTFTVHGMVTSDEFNDFRMQEAYRSNLSPLQLNEGILTISSNSVFTFVGDTKIGSWNMLRLMDLG